MGKKIESFLQLSIVVCIHKAVLFYYVLSLMFNKLSSRQEANQIENRDEQRPPQPQRHSFSRSAPDNIVIINNLTIINGGLDVANESLKMYTEFMENVIRFNMNAMRVAWNPFLNLSQPKLENKE
jgi:hypothetical protein